MNLGSTKQSTHQIWRQKSPHFIDLLIWSTKQGNEERNGVFPVIITTMLLFGIDSFVRFYIICFFLCWQFQFYFSADVDSTGFNSSLCQPVSPSTSKEQVLDKFRKENYAVPLMFWHLQKAGGTTLCLTFLQSYEKMLERTDIKELYPGWENCNEPAMAMEIILHPNNTYLEKYRPKKKYLMAIEPSHSYRRHKSDPPIDPNDFPFKYHDQPATQRLLSLHSPPSYSFQNISQPEEKTWQMARDQAWNAAVHVIAVRHPFELAISALHYVFQPDRFTMLGR